MAHTGRYQPVTAYRETYVQPYTQGELTRQEQELLQVSTRMAGEIMSHRQMTHHVRSDDSAITHSLGSLIYSFAYVPIIAIITGALMMLATWAFEGDGWPMFLLWLLVWGVGCLWVTFHNREQGLRYSSAGIAMKEIESRENVAMYVIDRHVELLEKKWGVVDPRR